MQSEETLAEVHIIDIVSSHIATPQEGSGKSSPNSLATLSLASGPGRGTHPGQAGVASYR